MTEYGRDFQAAIAKLRASGFTERPFRVYVVPVDRIDRMVGSESNDGCYLAGRKVGMIFVAHKLTYAGAVDSLLHEYSHHVDMRPGETVRNFHRASWGATYGRVLEYFHKDASND